MKCCGNCMNSRTTTAGDFICSKNGRPASYLAVKDCYEEVASNAKELTIETKKMENTSTPQTKVCKKCGRELTIDHFARQAKSSDGYLHICRDCKGESMRAAFAKKAEELVKDGARKAEKKLEDDGLLSKKPTFKSFDTPPALEDVTLADIADAVLVNELRGRGWEVTCSKRIEL